MKRARTMGWSGAFASGLLLFAACASPGAEELPPALDASTPPRSTPEAGADVPRPSVDSGFDAGNCLEADFCPVQGGFDPTVTFNSVWGTAEDDVWFVGTRGTIVHYDGTSYTAVASGTTDSLFAVWGRSADDVWVLGVEPRRLVRQGDTWTTEVVVGDTYQNVPGGRLGASGPSGARVTRCSWRAVPTGVSPNSW